MIQALREKLSGKYTVALLFAILAFSIFIYIWVFGVNLLYLDEWAFASLVQKYQSNGLSFDLLFAPHNEHRVFFPRLFYLLTVPLSRMNSFFYMHFNAIVICIEFCIFYIVAKRQFKFENSRIPIWLIILPLFVFNFRQWENLIWAFQIIFYIVLVSSVSTLYLIERLVSCRTNIGKLLYSLLALAFGIIATFSGAMGFLVWIAGSIQLAIHWFIGKNKTASIFLFVFIIVGALSFFFYLNDLELPMNNNFEFALTNPLVFLRFFFCLISLTSIKWLSIIALPIGLAIFGISLFALYQAYKNNRLKENSFWVALYIFSILFALINSIGRAPFFFEFTDRSRYTTFTLLISISTFMLVYDYFVYCKKVHQKQFIKVFFYCLLALGIELNAIGLVYGYLNKEARLKSKEIVLNYKTQPLEKLKEIDPWLTDEFIEEVKEAAPFVEKHHYNVFKNSVEKK